MSPRFEQTVAALVEAMVAQRPLGPAPRADLAAITRYVLATHASTPDYLRLALRCLTLLFDAWPYLSRGRAFRQLPLSERIGVVERWDRSRLEARRALMTFYRAFVIFSLYSEPGRPDIERGRVEH
jgi:hypothetical protein